MKFTTMLSALAAAGAVSATPTPTEKDAPSKRASLPTIEVSGNGKSKQPESRTRGIARL